MAKQTFHCEHGHIWVGEDPVCPLHNTPAIETRKKPQDHGVSRIPTGSSQAKAKTKKPAKAEVKVQRLRCELGEHNWERPAQRGKPPKNCPEHQPAKPEPSERKPRNTETQGVTRPTIQPLGEIRQQYPNIDEESARVLTYVEREVNAPTWPRGREQEDISLLVKTYNNRLRAVARSSHVATPVLVEA